MEVTEDLTEPIELPTRFFKISKAVTLYENCLQVCIWRFKVVCLEKRMRRYGRS